MQVTATMDVRSRVNCVDISVDKKVIVSGSDDNLVRVWQQAAGVAGPWSCTATLRGHTREVYRSVPDHGGVRRVTMGGG